MNWMERMYELKGKDLYSQNGEGLYLEYVWHSLKAIGKVIFDIGSGDGFILSNSRHLVNNYGFLSNCFDKLTGDHLGPEPDRER